MKWILEKKKTKNKNTQPKNLPQGMEILPFIFFRRGITLF